MARPRFRRALIVGLAVVMAWAATGPAQAHYSEESRSYWFNYQPSPDICVQGTVRQNHGYHAVSTSALNRNCSYFWNTWFAQYQEYYKTSTWGAPGTYCGYRGWYQSPTGSASGWSNFHNWDIWGEIPCNNGSWVNVWISIDSWQYAWTDWYGWRGNAIRPITKHCHCP